MKTALITGISGQDGSLLADHLFKLGYRVIGLSHHPLTTSDTKAKNYQHLLPQIEAIQAQLTDGPALLKTLGNTRFDEVYHLGAASFASAGFANNYDAFDANVKSTYHLLDCAYKINPDCRFFYAGSSEMFGNNAKGRMTEADQFFPKTMYGISKVAGHEIARNYRELQSKFCVTGMLFNHESNRRGEEFVTRKITLAAARIKLGKQQRLTLGSLTTKRDWSAAEDFVRGFQLSLSHKKAQDYVFSSGTLHTIEEFAQTAFKTLGLNLQDHIELDQSLNRPSPTDLVGDHSRATKELGWKPEISFTDMIERMVRSDYDWVKNT